MMWPLVAVFCCVAAAVLAVRLRYVEVRIAGTSMSPAYEPGDRVLVRRVRARALRVGDVVVVEKPEAVGVWPAARRRGARQWVIKRVAALPGDPVPPSVRVAQRVVPPGELVVLGDAGRYSFDSKQHGFYPLSRVLGVALHR